MDKKDLKEELGPKENIILPHLTKNIKKGVYGCVDVVNEEGVFGWIVDLDSDELPTVELYVNDEKVAEAMPTIAKEDINEILGRKVISGFEFKWKELKNVKLEKRNLIVVLYKGRVLYPGKREYEVKPDYIGNFDSIRGLYLYGWAYNKANPTERVSLVVLVDGKAVGEVIAENFRKDLEEQGIGDGNHGFLFKLPSEYMDGKEHEIRVIFKEISRDLYNSPKKIKLSKYTGEVWGLDHNNGVSGKIINLENPNEPVYVELYEGDKLITSAWSNPAEGNKFTLWLPPEVMDGNIHIFSIRTGDGYTIGYYIGFVPYYLTPYDNLKEFSKKNPYHLSPVAKFRYEALAKTLRWILENKEFSQDEKDKLLKQTYKAFDILNTGWENLKNFDVLEFPKFDNPKVSIVIPVHNKFELTYYCLASILLATYDVPYEVIVVDDASTDETLEIEKIIKNIKIVRNEKNEMFVKSCNKGAKLGTGEYILILNNDVEVLDGWLKELLWVYENYNKVGFVGAKLLYPDFTLQEAGGIVWWNGQAWNYGRGDKNPYKPKYNYVRQVDYCSGACIMVPKQLWDELGGFDEEFAPAYWEETDLAFRIREKGYKVVYTPFAQVIHFEGMSAGKDVKTGIMKKYQEINEKKFRKRWQHVLFNRKELEKTPSHENADIVKDRGIILRVLVIDYEIPRPDKEGGGYATFQEIKLLQSLGFKVTFVPNNMAYLYGYVEDLQKMGVEVLYAPFYTSVREVIEKRGKEFDLFYIVRWYIAHEYVDLIRKINPYAKILFNNADLHFLRELREAIATQNRELFQKAIYTRDKELEVMRKVDLVLSYNETEHAVILSHNLDSTKVAKLPWVVYVKEKGKPFEERKNIAFLGNYRHTPNVVAVKWFSKEVIPLLKDILPDAKFLIYGANVTEEVKNLESEQVKVIGYVEDLGEVFENCRVFVAPLLSGAGIKGKVLEALSYGVPSVLSPIAAEGTGIKNGLEAFIVETPREYVEAIVKLYKNKEIWEKMSRNALEFVRTEYSFERGRELMRKALELVDIYVPENTGGFYARG